jgi:hypothetical protein
MLSLSIEQNVQRREWYRQDRNVGLSNRHGMVGDLNHARGRRPRGHGAARMVRIARSNDHAKTSPREAQREAASLLTGTT